MEKGKRQRGTNFSKEEELLLLTEVEKYKHIIECKMSDKTNLTEKNEAWKKIMAACNAKNSCSRSVEQIKIKYDNLKFKARKVTAANREYMRGTGGGPAGTIETDPVIEAILRIINKTTVIGLHSPFDCDNLPTKENNNREMTDAPAPIDSEIELEILAGDFTGHYTSEQEGEIIVLQQDWGNIVVPNMENFQGIATPEPEPEEQAQEAAEIAAAATDQTVETNSENLWTKYTPKKLRTPISKKLRQPLKPNFAREEYYRKKTELVEEEIKASKLHQEEMLLKRKRDSEEHNKKMELLQLEIDLKKKMLKEK